MKHASFILLLASLQLQAIAQTDLPKRQKVIPYTAKVRLTQGGTATGWLYSSNENDVSLLTATKKELRGLEDSSFLPLPRLQSVPIENINTIVIRRKNATTRGIFIGMASGAAAGALIGLISGDDYILPYPSYNNDPLGLGTIGVALSNAFASTAEEKALLGAAAGAVFGALTGAVIGSLAKKKFVIGGKKEKYRDLEGKLMQRLLVKP